MSQEYRCRIRLFSLSGEKLYREANKYETLPLVPQIGMKLECGGMECKVVDVTYSVEDKTLWVQCREDDLSQEERDAAYEHLGDNGWKVS